MITFVHPRPSCIAFWTAKLNHSPETYMNDISKVQRYALFTRWIYSLCVGHLVHVLDMGFIFDLTDNYLLYVWYTVKYLYRQILYRNFKMSQGLKVTAAINSQALIVYHSLFPPPFYNTFFTVVDHNNHQERRLMARPVALIRTFITIFILIQIL